MAAMRSRTMISGLAVVCVLWVWGGSQIRSENASPTKRWTVSSFLEFSRGTLGDAGANTYVTAAGEVKLINLWDLNRDGFIDIVLPNTHDNNEQIDLFIYWGVDENHVGRRTRLPSGGGTGQALGDLNGDGFTDLVVVNGRNGIKSNLDSFIYWGGAQGFEAGRRSELPTLGGMAAAVADLDGDGYPEIVFANSAWAGGRPSSPENASFLYWGSKEGFSIERRQSLPTVAATDVAVADLDRDGSPEIVFANEGSGTDLGGAMIYWGGAGGSYSADRRTVLPGQRSAAVALADLNGDQVPEIVLANRYRPLMREPRRPQRVGHRRRQRIHPFFRLLGIEPGLQRRAPPGAAHRGGQRGGGGGSRQGRPAGPGVRQRAPEVRPRRARAGERLAHFLEQRPGVRASPPNRPAHPEPHRLPHRGPEPGRPPRPGLQQRAQCPFPPGALLRLLGRSGGVRHGPPAGVDHPGSRRGRQRRFRSGTAEPTWSS